MSMQYIDRYYTSWVTTNRRTEDTFGYPHNKSCVAFSSVLSIAAIYDIHISDLQLEFSLIIYFICYYTAVIVGSAWDPANMECISARLKVYRLCLRLLRRFSWSKFVCASLSKGCRANFMLNSTMYDYVVWSGHDEVVLEKEARLRNS